MSVLDDITSKKAVQEPGDTDIMSKITKLKKLLPQDEIKVAVNHYNKMRYAIHDANVYMGGSSYDLLLKTMWLNALQTRVNARPDLYFI